MLGRTATVVACHTVRVAGVATIEKVVRRTCLALPEVSERLSHGEPTFFIREKKSFLTLLVDGHHDSVFPHLVCAAGHGVQSALITERPEEFFVPAYVGHRGWIGVRLDRSVEASEMVALCEDAYRTVAPASLRARLDATDSSER